MGRPCAFDRDEAIKTAMQLFLEKGYEATSVEDLTSALNISRASLYNAFGDKHGLLLASFDCAAKSGVGPLDRTAPVRDVLRLFFENLAAQNRGCFFLTLGAELSSHDEEVRQRVDRSLEATRTHFRELIEAARQRGELRSDIDTERASNALLGVTVSILTLARVHPDRQVIASVIDQALQILA